MRARQARSQQAAGHLLGDLDQVLELSDGQVAWVEGPDHAPVLKVAPLDVGAALQAALWSREDAPTAVMTSATIPPRLGERLGLAPGSYDVLDVGSPFAYDEQALLYCPVHLAEPRHPGYEAAMHDELAALIEAAEGRTLALFTSWRAMTAAADAMRPRVRWPVLTQSDLPKPALLAQFSADEHSCLFATMGFWQGVDVPGTGPVVGRHRPACRFPGPTTRCCRPAGPVSGGNAFGLIDLPRAATLLAQGSGRLIRSRADRGVVAVLDSRLGTARYRWDLIHALPPDAPDQVALRGGDVSGAAAGARRQSVAETLQGVGPALPVRVHLDEQLQEGPGGKLGPGPDSDLPQHAAAPADHDPLLRLPFDQNLAANPGPFPFGHPAGDRMGHLVAGDREQLLADQFGHPEGLGHVGDGVRRDTAAALPACGPPPRRRAARSLRRFGPTPERTLRSRARRAQPPASSWCRTCDRDTASTLLTTQIDGPETRPATKRSPFPRGAVASTTIRFRSTPSRARAAVWLSRSPSRVRGLWIPGVSTKTTWASGRVSTPRTTMRVVCATGEVIDTLWPRMVLSRVDLPTLGRPTRATKPDLTVRQTSRFARAAGIARGRFER